MFTIVKNKIYMIENEKMITVDISVENGIKKVGTETSLPKTYTVYSYEEIKAKFHIKEGQPYKTKVEKKSDNK